uniref:Uncharacterized protein n=1 Tax=Nymphaea colorata TaxID=210225 RepID=A0A5K0WMW5_9MAGN
MELQTRMDTSAAILSFRAPCLSRQPSSGEHESPPAPFSARTERGRRTRKRRRGLRFVMAQSKEAEGGGGLPKFI